MARKIQYAFDEESIPKVILSAGEEINITGAFTPRSPRSLWCRGCGYEMSFKNNRDYRVNFDGIDCPSCGIKHSTKSVIGDFNYTGDTITFQDIRFDGYFVRRTISKYKLISPGEHLLKIETIAPEVTTMTIQDAHANRLLPEYLIRDMRDNYADKLDPMLKMLFDITLDEKSAGACYYYGMLDYAKDLYTSNPALFIPLMETLHGEPVVYRKFESMYPDYLLPLTKQLLKDYNPVEERNRRWSTPIKWPKMSEYTNLEALTCVVAYYKSGLISFHQMKELLLKVDAINNPTFVRAFKSNYLQMYYLLSDLENEGVNLQTAYLDTKCYYRDKTHTFFRDYGLTHEQINNCFASAKDGLDLLIKLGSERRKKVPSKNP